MFEYKVLAISQRWTNGSFADKATREVNRRAEDGWRVVTTQHGWNSFLVSTLYVVLERDVDPYGHGTADRRSSADQGRPYSSDIQSRAP